MPASVEVHDGDSIADGDRASRGIRGQPLPELRHFRDELVTEHDVPQCDAEVVEDMQIRPAYICALYFE